VKFLFRWAFRLFLALMVLLVAAILLLDRIVREVAENRLQNRTGMDVSIGRVNVGLLSPEIEVEDFKIYNTAEFGGSPFLEVPEMHIEYDRSALFGGRLHYRLLRVTVEEAELVRSKAGRSNVQSIFGGKKAAKDRAGGFGWGGWFHYQFDGIDTLNLTARRVTMVNMADPGNARERNLDIRNQVITDLKTGRDLELKLALLLAEREGMGVFEYFPAAR
jgi:hypothetical protein